MLDLCLWKGRFPSRKAQFCTEFLKERAVFDSVVGPALETFELYSPPISAQENRVPSQ